MNFEFATANRVLFGPGRSRELPQLVRALGTRAIVVTGRSIERTAELIEGLRAQGLDLVNVSISGEPTTAMVTRATEQGSDFQADLVIAIGGGSAIDAGKAIAAMLTNPGHLLDYLEVVGAGRPIEQPPLPFVAVPTTAGTGAEVTRNAVLAAPDHKVKVSLRNPMLLPRLALVDPELTRDLPLDMTAATGLDALTQLIEPFVSCKGNPITDALCREGLMRLARSLPVACEQAALPANAPNRSDPRYAMARTDMSLASLFSGFALANAGLGAVHGFAAPIGGRFNAPHGAVCASLLPHATAINIRALGDRAPTSQALRRYEELARQVTGNGAALAGHLVSWLTRLISGLPIPPLNRYGIGREHLADLVEQAAQASSMKGNPIPLTHSELAEILMLALAA